MNNEQELLLNHLISTGALTFGSTKLKSGRVSPYYISLRKAMDTGKGVDRVSRAYVKLIFNTMKNEVSFIHGPAYAGISLASSISMKLWNQYDLNVRFGYDRKEAKEHGQEKEKTLVGDLRDGDKVLIVDDVLTTGKTKLQSWHMLSALAKHLKPMGVAIAVDREEIDESHRVASEHLKTEGLEVRPILKITEIFDWLKGRKIEGKTIVDDVVYEQFRDYMTRYGRSAV